ncbi:MAG: hemerythrin domain-containing protein [Planctomycetes bacterium]|nr:hemerythrin domain-containing protein [Planctomycetota bacterium]
MSETGSDACPDDAVARQHIQIEGLLGALHNRFESGRELSCNLVSLLNSLTSHLESHFELEEDGYYAELVQIAPRLSGRVDALIQQHGLFLDESRKLAVMAQEAFANSVEAPELAKRFEQFRQELLAHEKEETGILQEAYTRDLGEKD